jgi:hypothetical protein
LQSVTANLPSLNATSCADALDKTAQSLNASDRQTLNSATVTNVQVSGDTAMASVGTPQPATLTKVGGRWLISGGIAP